MWDCHIHPSYSTDAKESVNDFAEAAIKAGLSGICFTTHIDLNPSRSVIDYWMNVDGVVVMLSPFSVRRYLDDIEKAKRKFDRLLEIEAGFEFSYGVSYQNIIADFIKEYPVKWTIGSIHTLEDVGFTSRAESFSLLYRYKPYPFLEKYLNKLVDLSRSSLFSTIGHIDGYRKYSRLWWDKNELENAENELYPEYLKRIAQTGMPIEINTASMRRGFTEPYPNDSILMMIKDAKIPVNSVNSDAHRPEQTGFMVKEIRESIVQKGFEIVNPF